MIKFANIMCNASLCGLGEAAQSALLSAVEHFPETFEIKEEVVIR
jgi:NADH-quinone oxidoreductase subunit F